MSNISESFAERVNLELRHPRCVYNIKVQCKEVKKHNKFISVIMSLIERHVSAYSEANIRYCYTNTDDEISTSNSSITWNILVSYS